jgi:hypothetical protein
MESKSLNQNTLYFSKAAASGSFLVVGKPRTDQLLVFALTTANCCGFFYAQNSKDWPLKASKPP